MPPADKRPAFTPKRASSTSFGAALVALLLTAQPAAAELQRTDAYVSATPDIELFVRHLSDTTADRDLGPLLLLHGARVGGLASFDVEEVSLAEDLARRGFQVYVADLRGYGRSTFPPAMQSSRFAGPPAVRTAEAVVDVKALLDWLRARYPQQTLSAFGWATGSHWLAATEAAHPGSLDRLVFYNSVYGGEGPWRLTELFAKPGQPSVFDLERFGAYRLSDADSLVGRWTEAEGISPAFVERYVELAMEGDETAEQRQPASFRHPSGAIADTLEAVHGGPLYDAGRIRAEVLLLRSGKDFWSRPIDYRRLAEDLQQADRVEQHTFPEASHYLHLEPGPARNRFLEVVTDFLADGRLADPS